MGQQEQRKEVASSMKWIQSIVLFVNDGIACLNSNFLLKKLKAEWYILVWSWNIHVSFNKFTYKTLHPIILMYYESIESFPKNQCQIDTISLFLCWKLKIRVTSKSKMSKRRSNLSINSIITPKTKHFQDRSTILWVEEVFYITFPNIHKVEMKQIAWFEVGPYACMLIKLLSFDKISLNGFSSPKLFNLCSLIRLLIFILLRNNHNVNNCRCMVHKHINESHNKLGALHTK